MPNYQMPPTGIANLVDAPLTPSFSLDPTRRWAIIVEQPSAPPIEEIARKELKLAGTRLDPTLWTASHLSFGYAPRLRRLILPDGETPLAVGAEPDLVVEGLPETHGVRYVTWRPGGGGFAFLVKPERSSTLLEVWAAEFDPSLGGGGSQACVARRVSALKGRTVNAVHGKPFKWTVDGRLLCQVVPPGHPLQPPAEPLAPTGPVVQETDGSKKKPARTYQDLLKSPHDANVFTHFSTSEVLLLEQSVSSGPAAGGEWSSCVTVGPPCGAMVVQLDPSPDSSCALVKVLTPGQFSYQLPLHRFGFTLEAWDLPPPTQGLLQGMIPPPQQSDSAPAKQETAKGGSSGSSRLVLKEVPLQESVPISFDARPTGPRQTSWHPCFPCTLIWAEALDKGDPEAPAPGPHGYRDQLVTRSAPFEQTEDQALFGLETRWAGWWFTEEGVGLVKERRHKDRREVAWRLDPPELLLNSDTAGPSDTAGNSSATVGSSPNRVQLWERNYQDRYGDPGSPEEVRNARGQLVLQTVPGKGGEEGSSSSGGSPIPAVYFMGNGASPKGDRPFVDARPLEPGATVQRVWRSPAGPWVRGEKEEGSGQGPGKEGAGVEEEEEDPKLEVGGLPVSSLSRRACFENPVFVLGSKGTQRLLLRRESNAEPPNFFVRTLNPPPPPPPPPPPSSSILGGLKEKAPSSVEEVAVTSFEHPQPQLKDVKTELIRYARADGVSLTAQLYLPAGYDPVQDGPRPTLMWAYPQSFKNKSTAGQVQGSPFTFTRASWSRPTMWLSEGWVVLERFAMPILGEGDEEPNDTFVEQVVANAEAAVSELCKRGVSARGAIAVGGHSYGAFMTAHLLAHTDLFCCGIARSGAMNRTLTPMGFQAEERDYWQAPDTYHKLSPFSYAKVLAERRSPLLLVHGDNDSNSGTHPMQSERMYSAVAGQGGICKLVLLPHESHGYRARESVMHVLHEQHAWLTRWVVDKEEKPPLVQTQQKKLAQEEGPRPVVPQSALPWVVLGAVASLAAVAIYKSRSCRL